MLKFSGIMASLDEFKSIKKIIYYLTLKPKCKMATSYGKFVSFYYKMENYFPSVCTNFVSQLAMLGHPLIHQLTSTKWNHFEGQSHPENEIYSKLYNTSFNNPIHD